MPGNDSRLPIVVFFIALNFVVIGYFYQETLTHLISLWNDSDKDYGHGYLVLLISLYLVYSKKALLSELPVRFSWLGVIFTVLVSFAWSMSVIGSVTVFQGLGLVLLIAGLVWASMGFVYLRHLMLPILYLLFAIPIWSFLLVPLQNLTADVVYPLVRYFGIPALRDEYSIILPSGTLTIEQACSGLRYLIAALTLAVLYGYLNYSTLRARIYVFVIAAVAAVFANILRVFLLIKVAYDTEMQHPWIKDGHGTMGWVLFGGVMFALLAIDVVVHKVRSGREVSLPSRSQESSSPALSATSEERQRYNLGGILQLSCVPAILLVGPWLVHQYETLLVSPIMPEQITISTPVGWASNEGGSLTWQPRYSGAVSRTLDYANEEALVRFYLGAYNHQVQGNELINESNKVEGTEGWHRISSKNRSFSHGGKPFIETMVGNQSGERLLVWYRYNVATFDVTSGYLAKLAQVVGFFSGNNSAVVFAYATPVLNDVDTARETLSSFTEAMQWQEIKLYQ